MQIIGHRGASGYAAENTLASFQKALSLGVDMIELDVYVLKTGEVVVFHDQTVDRTTNGHGKITNLSFQELRQLDDGNGQQVPLLTEVIELLDRRVALNIELKGAHSAQPVAKIIKAYIKKGWSSELFLVSSFKLDELQAFARLCPQVRVSALFSKRITYNALDTVADRYSFGLDSALATPRTVAKIHARGLKVYAYTVNNRRQAQHLRRLKVDGIFSNYPDKFTA